MTKDEAMKLALEALEIRCGTNAEERGQSGAITALREALAEQPAQQEPVAWYRDEDGIRIYYESKVWDDATPLYTSPPAQRTWVGLTNNELQPIADEYRILFGGWVEDFARAIESKLREKNT